MPAEDPSRPALDVARVACRPGWRVEVLEASPSTNADLAGRARDGEPAGLVVVAEHQTAGRGRLDRTWTTPPRAALTFSLLVAPDRVPVARWPWLPLLTGLAVADGVRRVAGVEPALKWPNDVLLDERKLAGILVERVERPAVRRPSSGSASTSSSTREELPVPTATSLALAGAASLDRTALLVAVLDAFTARYDAWLAAAGGGLPAPYTQACSTLGGRCGWTCRREGCLLGRAVGVDEEGRLRVDDGLRVHVLGAGDVVHVRPGAAGPA